MESKLRVKTFRLSINDEPVGLFNLKDSYFGQKFEIGSFSGDSDGKLLISLKILDVYKGDKYSDTANSEINFSGTGDH